MKAKHVAQLVGEQLGGKGALVVVLCRPQTLAPHCNAGEARTVRVARAGVLAVSQRRIVARAATFSCPVPARRLVHILAPTGNATRETKNQVPKNERATGIYAFFQNFDDSVRYSGYTFGPQITVARHKHFRVVPEKRAICSFK